MRSVTSGDGRRLITVWRDSEPHTGRPSMTKAFAATHSKSAAKLPVKFRSEAVSAFSPAVHRTPANGKSQRSNTH